MIRCVSETWRESFGRKITPDEMELVRRYLTSNFDSFFDQKIMDEYLDDISRGENPMDGWFDWYSTQTIVTIDELRTIDTPYAVADIEGDYALIYTDHGNLDGEDNLYYRDMPLESYDRRTKKCVINLDGELVEFSLGNTESNRYVDDYIDKKYNMMLL